MARGRQGVISIGMTWNQWERVVGALDARGTGVDTQLAGRVRAALAEVERQDRASEAAPAWWYDQDSPEWQLMRRLAAWKDSADEEMTAEDRAEARRMLPLVDDLIAAGVAPSTLEILRAELVEILGAVGG